MCLNVQTFPIDFAGEIEEETTDEDDDDLETPDGEEEEEEEDEDERTTTSALPIKRSKTGRRRKNLTKADHKRIAELKAQEMNSSEVAEELWLDVEAVNKVWIKL